MSGIEKSLFEKPPRNLSGFLDAAFSEDLDSLDVDVAFMGAPYAVPYFAGQCAAAGAPDYIRSKSFRVRRACRPAYNFDLETKPFNLGRLRMADLGNIRTDPADFPATVGRITSAVERLLDKEIFPVVFGGDDAVPIPVVRAFEKYGPLEIVQIDEHLDFADDVAGVREGYSSPMRRVSEMPWVRRVLHVGARAYGPAEQVEATRAAGNTIFTAADLRRRGRAAAAESLSAGGKYFISLDFDGLDPSCFPAVSNPEPGGLGFEDICGLFTGLAERGKVAGIVFTEMVPAHDLNGLSGYCAGRLAVNLLHAVFRDKT